MAGSADIRGRQNYVMGIGHPATEATNEAPPAMLSTDSTGKVNGILGGDGQAFSIQKRKAIALRPVAITADTPTITYSATAPASGYSIPPTSRNVQLAGCSLSYNSATNLYLVGGAGGFAGVDFILNSTSVTLGWKSDISTAERFMFWVDGLPVSLTPATPSVSTVAGSFYYVTLTFGAQATRRIEILGTNLNSLISLVVPNSGSISPAPTRRKIHIVGDSFNGGSAALTSNTQLPSAQIAMKYDCSVSASALGGTGYVQTNGGFQVFGDSGRVALAQAIQPDDIVFMGSVNDDGLANIQSAALACWAAYKAAVPLANIIVFGPQGTNQTDTLSANRKANCLAVLAAAQQANLTYYDMTGWVSSANLSAFATFTFYAPGQLVTYLGSIWQHEATVSTQYPGTGAPGQNAYQSWTLRTLDLFGTGKVGSTTGDGTRDTRLYSDNIHPTAAQCQSLANRMIEAVASSQ